MIAAHFPILQECSCGHIMDVPEQELGRKHLLKKNGENGKVEQTNRVDRENEK